MSREEGLDRELRNALAGRGGTTCPGEAALVAFYRGGLSEAEAEATREHLAACASCVELARDARAFVDAMGGPGIEVMPMSRAKRWLAFAAAFAAASILGIWLARRSPVAPIPEARTEAPVPTAPKSWKNIPVSVAAYVPAPEDELVFRSDEPPGSRGFAEAMAPYARGDYAAAEAVLARILLAYPHDPRASFYRGVSLLLIGRPEDAVPLLQAAAESGPPPAGVRWYLALAQLKSGNEDAALRELDRVAGEEGAHRLEAAQLAQEVRSARDTRQR